jgi:hypothetical protein
MLCRQQYICSFAHLLAIIIIIVCKKIWRSLRSAIFDCVHYDVLSHLDVTTDIIAQ